MNTVSKLAVASLLVLVQCSSPADVGRPGDGPDGSAPSSSSAGSSSAGSNSSQTGSSSGSSVSDGGGSDAACSSHAASDAAARAAPVNHRGTATACAPADSPCVGLDSGGGQACTTDADCAAPDGSFTYFTHCLRGQCAANGCLDDSDCASNEACACSSLFYGGNACFHPNLCIPADCHVDSDCGPGGFCSPSIGYCGTFEAYHCQRPSDPCVDPTTDCSCPGSFPAACTYSPASGQWVCGEASVCAG